MRVILAWLLLFFTLDALEIQVNFAKENNENFSVLNLSHQEAFECEENKDVYNDVTSITCKIKTIADNFVPTNTAFFGIQTSVSDSYLIVTITPKYKIRLFSTFLDLKRGASIPKERPKKSKQWQVVGYISKVPFISDRQTQGLNFPIKIPSNQNFYIGQLDINLRPLQYEEGADFKKLKDIKEDYDRGNYANVIKEVDLSLMQYPTSIFKRDFLLYKIRSLAHTPTRDNIDATIQTSLAWVRAYPSEKSIPEVLYLLANAYIHNRLTDEAYHYFQRIINEYSRTDWSALSKMQIASNFSKDDRFKVSDSYFAEAYNDAKSQGVKDQILVQWGLSRLQEGDEEGAKIIDDVIAKDPSYFVSQRHMSMLLIQTLVTHKLYKHAGKIASYMIDHLSINEDDAMQLAFDIGKWYELDGDTQKAYEYNERFLKKYPNTKQYEQVAARNHQLLFQMDVDMDDEKKLQLFDEIIAKYPDSVESQNAYLQKAQTLFNLKRFNEVLQIQNHIPSSPLIAQSKSQIILRLLANGECKQVPYYLQGSDTESFGELKIALFDCLYSLSYYKDARALIPNLNQESLQEELPWLYRLSQVLNKLGDFVQSRNSGTDVLDIAKTLNATQYYDIAFVIFDDLIELKFTQQAQKFSSFIQEHFKEDARSLGVWYALLQIAQKENNPNSTQIYAEEILSLQDKLKNFDLSPIVDFVLIDSLMQNKSYAKAQEVLASLLKKKIEPEDMQKAFYMQGSILRASGEKNYKQSFEQCVNIQKDSNWKNLCLKSLELD